MTWSSEMKDPVVSVVVPFYNGERFLPEAVESVRNQTYEDWELILVDDGSKDGASSLAQSYANQDVRRIRCIDHPGHANRGSSATRNLGIASARGEYVAFLDADDVWEPNKLADQVALFRCFPAIGMVAGATTYWYSWMPGSQRADRCRVPGGPLDQVVEPPLLLSLLYPLGKGMSPSASNLAVRRDVLDRVGGFEDHFRGMYDDQALLVKLYLETATYVSSSNWDRYRRHPNSMTYGMSEQDYHAVRREFLRWFGNYLDTQGVDDKVVRRALERARWPYRRPQLAALRSALGRALARGRSLASQRRRT